MLQERRTDIDRLDANALFDVCNVCIVCNLVRKDLGFAERVDEGGATRARCTCVFCGQVHEKTRRKMVRRVPNRVTHREKKDGVPTTITVNWTPFLTLFPLRLAYDMMRAGK